MANLATSPPPPPPTLYTPTTNEPETTKATTTTSTLTNPLTDPWTPSQELQLLKALVRFKPVGLHAHFRMLSIQQHLLSSGTCTTEDVHTRIPGIWAKLRTLYDLEKLDEREDAGISSVNVEAADDDEDGDGGDDDDDSSEGRSSGNLVVGGGPAYWRDFELPTGDEGVGADFEKLMWERRLAPEGSESPELNLASSTAGVMGGKRRRESTVAGTDEPRSSPVASSVTRSGRGGRRGGRVSRLKGEAVDVGEGRSSRRDSKAASEVGNKDEDGDETMEDAEEENDVVTSSNTEEEDSDDQDEDERRTPVRRGRGGRRGRGRRGRRRG